MKPERISTRPNLQADRVALSNVRLDENPARPFLETALPVGEDPGGLPAGHEGSEQAQHQSRAVEQHVETVRDQPQAVGPHAVEQLHEGEGLQQHTAAADLEERRRLCWGIHNPHVT